MGIINADELAKSYKLSLLKKIKAGDLHDDDLFQISSIRTNPKYFYTNAIDLEEFTKYIALKIGEHTGVEVTPYHDSGDKIATITVNNVPVDIYASDIELLNTLDPSNTTKKIGDLSVGGVLTSIYADDTEAILDKPDIVDAEPYLLRDSASGTADRMVDELVGGTVAWNQIVQNGNFADGIQNWSQTSASLSANDNTLTITPDDPTQLTIVYQPNSFEQNHKYFVSEEVMAESNTTIIISIGGNFIIASESIEPTWKIISRVFDYGNNTATNFNILRYWTEVQKPIAYIKNVNIIDLTQMFGATIANYIYSLEQAEAGAGVTFFRKLFPEDYYAYNAGELISVKATAHIMRDASDNIIGNYPLDANLELRGLFKLDASNKLYCDGDTYESSGVVGRRYGIIDLGSLNWIIDERYTNKQFYYALPSSIKTNSVFLCSKFYLYDSDMKWASNINKTIGIASDSYLIIVDNSYTSESDFRTAMNGVNLLFELATPTIETAESFAGIQVVDGDGTEEYIDSRDVPLPVGHNTRYLNGVRSEIHEIENLIANLPDGSNTEY